jgi:hypothetical protein
MHFKIWQSSFNLPIDLNEISHHMHVFDKIMDSLHCVITPCIIFLASIFLRERHSFIHDRNIYKVTITDITYKTRKRG